MTPTATILIPTHDHGPTLRFSIASALAQTVPVEVFVVGDGVPDETRQIMSEIAANDPRVRFFDYPKGPRHGEIYRHEVLQHANARIVCYLADDDLYLPHHVEAMDRLLENADFAHAAAVQIQPGGGIFTWTVDLRLGAYQREFLEGRNRIPFSAGAHTLAIYRQLKEGWSSAPQGTPIDLFMWQKFLRHPGCRFQGGETPSVVVIPAALRRGQTPAERLWELEDWSRRMTADGAVAQLNALVLAAKIQEAAAWDGHIIDVRRKEVLRSQSTLQVFFPVHGGYNERESADFPVPFATWQTISVETTYLHPGVPIRIDPANQPCLIELSRIQLSNLDGEILWKLTESNAHQVRIEGTAAAISRGPVIQVLSDGDDPTVLLPPLEAPVKDGKARLEFVVRLDAGVDTLAKLFGKLLRIAQA